jgi:hypothetical protein
MDQPSSVKLTHCARQRHRQSEELSHLHRLPDKAIKRLASCVINREHRLSTLAHQFEGLQCPRTSQVLPKFEFMREAIDALKGRMLSFGRDGYEGVPIAV